MKGVIFNIVGDVVIAAHGEVGWDRVLERAGLDGVYTSLGNYDDTELARIVEVAAAAAGLTADETLRWVGRNALPIMVERWPGFFAAHRSCVPLLRSLNTVIHPEVHALYPGARCPHFDMTADEDGTLVLGYRSPRRLCGLAHGFVEGTAAHYRERVALEHRSCQHHGDAACRIAVSVG